MKFFIDENLSPQLTSTCHARGYDATSVRDRAGLSRPDHSLGDVSRGGADLRDSQCRRLSRVGRRAGVHPGLITMPSVVRARQIELLEAAISFIEQSAQEAGLDPAMLMSNHVVEINEAGACELFQLPASAKLNQACNLYPDRDSLWCLRQQLPFRWIGSSPAARQRPLPTSR